MAGALAGHSLHASHKAAENIQGDKGLNGAGKAASVDPAGSPALQQILCQGQQQGYRLAAALPVVGYILEIHEGGAAGLADMVQEGIEISLFQSVTFQKDPLVVPEKW